MLNEHLNKILNQILMAGMNRLSPLIVRRVGPMAAAANPIRWDEWPPRWVGTEEQANALLADVKQFVVGWVGGLIFFGTFLS